VVKKDEGEGAYLVDKSRTCSTALLYTSSLRKGSSAGAQRHPAESTYVWNSLFQSWAFVKSRSVPSGKKRAAISFLFKK